MSLQPATPEALALLMQGIQSLSRMEATGLRIDVAYLEETIKAQSARIADMETELRAMSEYRLWAKHYGNKMCVGNTAQLGHVVFKLLGHKRNPQFFDRKKNKEMNSAAAFEHLDLSFIKQYFRIRKLTKARTDLQGMQREVVNGRIHPDVGLHTAESYRSCVAKGTLVEVVRDVAKDPKGIPIEDVRSGDYVYCYDNDLKLTICRVLWAGQTGHRKVVRLHWSARGKIGHLDVTPEHKIRLVSGEYVRAEELFTRTLGMGTKRFAKRHALAMGRIGDRVWETGNDVDLHDHRLVYGSLVGRLDKEDVVHHKDGNHLNNLPDNLQKMSKSEHSSHHAPTSLTDEVRARAYEVRRERIRDGKIVFASGSDHHGWKSISRFSLLRRLAEAKGRVTYLPWCYHTTQTRVDLFSIDLKIVLDRYGGDGRYISRGRLVKAASKTTRQIREELKVSFYKVRRLYDERGISLDSPVHNHRITHIEWLDEKQDVYDLEVEGSHNFIANEICVHNSCSRINFQNQQVRDKEIAKIVRTCVIPSKGRVFLEVDYVSHEVRMAACYNKDPKLISYVTGGGDMHTDMAKELFLLEEAPSKESRYCAKNMFVFAQFYGSVFSQCAPKLWDGIARLGLKRQDGVPLFQHLKEQGIKKLGTCDYEKDAKPGTFEFHVKAVERRMWDETFSVYNQWRKDWWALYQSQGGVNTLTGFRMEGVFRRNQIFCDPIQGSAFHCLLWSIIQIQKELRRRQMKSRIVMEIHDSMLFDAVPDEVPALVEICQEVMVDQIADHWDWFTVPLAIEVEICEGSWATKKPMEMKA